MGSEMNCLSKATMALNHARLPPVAGQSVNEDDEFADPESSAPWTIDRAAFEELLSWLAPDPEAAGRQYELVRQKLMTMFRCRGCSFPEDMADETINRVIRKLPKIKPGYVGNPINYFCGVARRIYLEYTRPPAFQKPLPASPAEKESEALLQRLDSALSRLAQADRELILSYYQGEGPNKIEHRRRMAGQLGITPNTLRLRIYRIRSQLKDYLQAQE